MIGNDFCRCTAQIRIGGDGADARPPTDLPSEACAVRKKVETVRRILRRADGILPLQALPRTRAGTECSWADPAQTFS